MDAWNKKEEVTAGGGGGGSMDRRWCTSHRPLLGLTFNGEREEEEEREHSHSRQMHAGMQRHASWGA